MTRSGRAAPPRIDSPRIALCFFGITRSLARTLPSIEAHVIAPAREIGDARLYGHFFLQDRIDNPRTGEHLDVAEDEHKLIAWNDLALEAPDSCLETWEFARVLSHGDQTGDGGRTTRNLVHQLHSIREVSRLAAPWMPDLWVFVRPDLRYADSLGPTFTRALAGADETAYLPLWQWRGGLNDRFAVIRGAETACAYGHRVERMQAFCEARGCALHAERFLGFALEGRRIRRIRARATRVRANGSEEPESFSFQTLESLHTRVETAPLPRIIRRIGHRGLRGLQDLANLTIPS